MNLVEDDPVSSDPALFMGDKGELALETRRVLVQLLLGPVIDGQRHSKQWTILLRDEDVIRRRLADLFLELTLDKDTQIAFTRQADTGDLPAPLLLRRLKLTFVDSILLLYLRQTLTQAYAQGERAVIATQEIVEYLMLYQRATNTDQAGFVKRIQSAIEKFKKHNVLRRLRANEDRFEISPALKLLFTAEEVQALTQLYQNKLAEEDPK